MQGVTIKGNLILSKSEFTKVAIDDAHVGGTLGLAGSKSHDAISCVGIGVSNVLIDSGSVFAGPIRCMTAKITRSFYISHGRFQNAIDFSGSEIDGDVGIGMDSIFSGPIDFSHTHIRGSAVVAKSKCESDVSF